MTRRPVRQVLAAALLFAALAGCSRTSEQPRPTDENNQPVATVATAPTQAPVATEAAAPTAPPATEAAAPTAPSATETPLPTEEPSRQNATAIPTAAPIAGAAGTTVLRLAPGSGDTQVGIAPDPFDPNLLLGPNAFRIGADNSIRILDRLNKRLLFFAQSGALARTQRFAEAADPIDFIVSTQGETFVYDAGSAPEPGALRENPQVLRYDPAGKLTSSFPINPQVFATGIMLTSDQDLVLVGGSFGDNALTTTVFHAGKPVDPSHQPLTVRRGMATPRSAVLFSTAGHDGGTTDLSIGILTGESGPILSNLPVPAGARFVNVDRALNLYFVLESPDSPSLQIWQVDPSGAVVGGASVDFAGCQHYDWRSLYVAQDGALWSMCTTSAGTSLTQFQVVSPQGQPLPQAAASPPEGIAWGSGGPGAAA